MITYHPSLLIAHQVVERLMQSKALQEDKSIVIHPYVNQNNTSEVGYILQQDHHHYQKISENNYQRIAITQDGVGNSQGFGIKVEVHSFIPEDQRSHEKEDVGVEIWLFNESEVERVVTLLIKTLKDSKGFQKKEFQSSDITSQEVR